MQRNKIPDTMEYMMIKLLTGGYAVSNLFKDFLSTVYSNQSPNINNCISDINDSFYTSNLALIKLSVEEVFQSLSILDLNLCPGPDGIPNILLHSCKYSLAVPIHKLFSRSLSKGVFPFQWRNITPIHKSGIKNLVSNYRPISKLSALPKLLEMLMMPWLTFSFKNLINTTQHGFIKGCSDEMNLLCFYNAISKSMESGTQTDVIYTDFSKAFDSGNQSLLLAKLRLYGISRPLVILV